MLTSDKIDYKSSDSEINDPTLLSTKLKRWLQKAKERMPKSEH